MRNYFLATIHNSQLIIHNSQFVIHNYLYISLALQFICNKTQLIIPLCSETTDKGLFEENIYRKIKFLSLLPSTLTDVPAVIVKGGCSTGKTFLANWIKCAADRFAESSLAITICTFKGTKAASFVVTGEDTVFSIDNTGYKVALLISISHSLLIYNGLGRCRQIVPHRVKDLLYAVNLFYRDGGSGVAFYAALALAHIKVAAETLCKHIGRHQNITDLYYGKHSFFCHFLFLLKALPNLKPPKSMIAMIRNVVIASS